MISFFVLANLAIALRLAQWYPCGENTCNAVAIISIFLLVVLIRFWSLEMGLL